MNLLALLRLAARAAREVQSGELAQQLQQLMMSCCQAPGGALGPRLSGLQRLESDQEGQLAVLAAMSEMATHPQLAQNCILPHLDVISNTSLPLDRCSVAT